MPKNHEKKPHRQGVGLELVGNASELINELISDDGEKEWALNEVNNEGPDHKQVYSALLLSRMYKLVQSVEKLTGVDFAAEKGVDIISAKDNIIIPVQLPATVVEKEQLDAVTEAVSHSPSHELVAFTALLQAVEWSIKAISKRIKT